MPFGTAQVVTQSQTELVVPRIAGAIGLDLCQGVGRQPDQPVRRAYRDDVRIVGSDGDAGDPLACHVPLITCCRGHFRLAGAAEVEAYRHPVVLVLWIV